MPTSGIRDRAGRSLAIALAALFLCAPAAPAHAADERTRLPAKERPGKARPPAAEAPEDDDPPEAAQPAPEAKRPPDKAGSREGKARPGRKTRPNQLGIIRDFPEGTPDGLLREAFRCALDHADEGAGFECYAALNVEQNRDNDNALQHLRLYQWRYFRQRASSYLVDGKEFAVKVTRRDPARVGGKSQAAKLFLRSKIRDNPAPIMFRREAGSWRIYSSSL